MMQARGFTLVELMIVMAILAVLGTLAYPSYARYIVKARRIEAQIAMIDALQKEEAFYSGHNRYVAFSATAMPAEPKLKWWSGGTARASAYELDARACPEHALTECVQIRARPGTDKVDARFADSECGTLTITSAGEHHASGSSDRCWP
jgi:type IV pilus assembly protein PilE